MVQAAETEYLVTIVIAYVVTLHDSPPRRRRHQTVTNVMRV